MTTCDCEPFAHENCPTADATARTEAKAREVVAMYGIRSADVNPDDLPDPDGSNTLSIPYGPWGFGEQS